MFNLKFLSHSRKSIASRISCLLILILLAPQEFSLIQAQTDDDANINYSKAAVKIDGYNLFNVRGNSSVAPEERAELISKRIETIAKDASISPEAIEVISKDDFDEIVLNGVLLLRIFDADASLEGISRGTFSFGVKQRIKKAIYNYRYERSKDVLIEKLLNSLAALFLSFILIFITRFVFKKVNTFLENRLKKKLETIETKSFQLIRSNQIWITFYSLSKTLKYLLVILILLFTVQYIFGLFPWTRFISVSFLEIFIKPITDFGTAIINFIPNLAFLIVIFILTRYALKLLRLLFTGISQGNFQIANFETDWAMPTYKIVRIFLIAFAVIVAYPYIPGSDSDAFKGVSLFLGVLLSLGSTSVIGNLIAGYTMIYRKTFKVGDVVQIDDYVGRVTEIKLFVTRLRTPKNEEIIIPNSNVLNTNVINYSSFAKDQGLIIHTTVGIGYETPWRQVEEMLKLAAERTEGILKDPPPFVLQKSLGDFAVNYELNAYINDPTLRPKIYNNLHQNILDIFNENNVQIMTPAYEGDPETPKVVPKEQWFTPVIGKPDSQDKK